MTNAPRKRPKPGDVLLLTTPGGVAYLHYLGRHPDYGDAISVSRMFAEESKTLSDQTFAGAYVTFYPVKAAVAQGLVQIVGHLSPPSVPLRLRRPGAMSGRRIDTWVIEDGTTEIVRSTLSEDDMKIPIASIWNHEFLVQRVVDDWHPGRAGNSL